MFTELDTCKALFQSLTSNYDDEESTECETNLYQLGLRLMYTLCALQYIDLIRQHPTTSNDLLTRVENEGVLGALNGAYLMAGSSLNGRMALAKVFGMGNNLECLLPLAHLMETRDTGKASTSLVTLSQKGHDTVNTMNKECAQIKQPLILTFILLPVVSWLFLHPSEHNCTGQAPQFEI